MGGGRTEFPGGGVSGGRFAAEFREMGAGRVCRFCLCVVYLMQVGEHAFGGWARPAFAGDSRRDFAP